jgi:hypothetical protein
MLKLTAHDNNTFTVVGFKTMLKTLKTLKSTLKLTALGMQLPHVKELDINQIGMYLLLNLGVGDRGAQFIVQNIKHLTKLSISIQ